MGLSSTFLFATVLGLGLLTPSSWALPAMSLDARQLGSQQVMRRAIMKGDNYIPLGQTSVPLTPLLLIFCALAFACIGLAVALLNLCCINGRLSRSSRQVMDERARAKQELRIRGGGPRPGLSPSGSPTPGSSSSLEQGQARRLPPNKIPKRVGGAPGSPRQRSGEKRKSRNYRGTSFSLAEVGKHSKKSPTVAFGLPVLGGGGESSSSGSSVQVNSRDGDIAERGGHPISMGQRGSSLQHRDSSSSSASPVPPFVRGHFFRTSSVGRGADLHKSRQSVLGGIPVNPSAMDRTYVTAAEYGHPLDHSQDLRRHMTDPTSAVAASRRNSALSIYENASSENHSYIDSLSTSRMGSFSQTPLQPLGSPQLGHGSLGSLAGHFSGSGYISPRNPGYVTPPGSAASPIDPRSISFLGRTSSSQARAYDSDDGDAITAQSGLLSSKKSASTAPAHRR